jgi:protein-S-isoprenylcysteine O-methyltransferase Ste14
MAGAQSKYGGAKVRFPPPLIFLALVAGGVVVQRSIWPIAIHLGLWSRIVGGAIALAGLTMVIAARLWFKRSGQNPVPWTPSPQLLVDGVYRLTRNPMYVGLTLFQLGLGAALDNLWIAALAPIGLAVVHFIAVRPEEAYLTERFGQSYLRYKAAVRRYL